MDTNTTADLIKVYLGTPKRIGVSSQNFRTITGHAGKARRFLIFSENAQGDWVEVERLDLPLEMSMHEFQGTEHPLFSVNVLITGSCGEGFLRKMAQRGIRVIPTSETDPLRAVQLAASAQPLPPPEPHEH